MLARMRRRLDALIAARAARDRLGARARAATGVGALATCAVLGVWLGSAQAAGPAPHAERDPLQVIAGLSPASGLGALQP